MRLPIFLLSLALLLCAVLPAQASEPAGSQFLASVDPAPASQDVTRDSELIREHERFASFAQEQVRRMNATIIGGRHSMQVTRGHDGLYRATYKAIDSGEVVCRVSRAQHDPRYFVGVLIYKELLMESVASSAEACRKGTFAPVTQKPQQVIYSSRRGGGWN